VRATARVTNQNCRNVAFVTVDVETDRRETTRGCRNGDPMPKAGGQGGGRNGNERQPHAKHPKAKAKRTGKRCRAPAVRGYRVRRMHGARGGGPTGKRNGNYRHGVRTKAAVQAVALVNLLSRLAQKSSGCGTIRHPTLPRIHSSFLTCPFSVPFSLKGHASSFTR